MEFFTKSIMDKLVNNNIIKKEDIELYSYGFQQMIFIALNFITTIVIGLLFNKLFESILFMLVYIPIRIYAGGYHSRTKLKCYIFSILMLSSVLYLLKLNLVNNYLTIIILTVISSFVILSLAPVEDKNKPLDELEIKVYRKRTIRNLILVLIILSIALLFKITNFSACVCIALLCNGIMLILGKINNSIRYK